MQTLNNAELALLSLLSYPKLAVKAFQLYSNNAVLFPKAVWPHLDCLFESYMRTLAANRDKGFAVGKDVIAANLSEAVQSDRYMTDDALEKCDNILQRFLSGDVPTEEEGVVFIQKVAQLDAGRKLMASISQNQDFAQLEKVISTAKQQVENIAPRNDDNTKVVYRPFQEIMDLTPVTPKIPCGINWLDELTSGGGREQELWLILGGTSGGKCLHPDTPVLLYDGRIKKAKDIVVGDQLMGPDSTPRNVLALGSGRSKMYKITPVKGDPYIVNKDHILTLVVSPADGFHFKGRFYAQNELVDIAVEDYIALSKTKKLTLKGVRTGADFAPIPEPELDPYFAGLYLGDGTRRTAQLTLSDLNLIDYCRQYAIRRGWRIRIRPYDNESCYEVRLACRGRGDIGGCKAKILPYVLNDRGNKFIHPSFKYGSRATRQALLAGLLDTDGNLHNGFYEITTKFDELAEDIVFVARSLGFYVHDNYCQKRCCNTGAVGMYHRINISGDFKDIPTIREGHEPFARTLKKSVLRSAITVEELPEGDYNGFVIDGDHRFLLGDFTITHNTALTVQYAVSQALMGNFTVAASFEQSLSGDIAERIISNVTGESLDKIRDRGFVNLPEDLQRKFWASVAGADQKYVALDMTHRVSSPSIDPKDNGGIYSVWQEVKKLKAQGCNVKTVLIDWLGAMLEIISACTGRELENAFQFMAQHEINIARQMAKEEKLLVIIFHQTDTKTQHAKPVYIPDKTCALNMHSLSNFFDLCITLGNKDSHNIMWANGAKVRKGNNICMTVKLAGEYSKIIPAPGWYPNTDGQFYNPAEVQLAPQPATENEVTPFSREIG